MEYYFLSYRWTMYGMDGWVDGNSVINMHPIEWLKNIRSASEQSEYQISFYDKITKEQYDDLYGWID